MTRIRLFFAALFAAMGLLTVVQMPGASAAIVHAEIGENGTPSTPPAAGSGELLHLCLTIRAAGSHNCIDI